MRKSHKVSVHASVSPLTMWRLEQMVEGNETFSSRSDAVEKSLDMMYFTWKPSIRVKHNDHPQSVAIEG